MSDWPRSTRPEPGALGRIWRLAHSVRPLHPWQVVGRVWAVAQRRAGLPRLPSVPAALTGHLLERTARSGHDPWNTREAVEAGTFTFIGRTASLGVPSLWAASTEPLLWRFNLHYFQYLHLLAPDAQAALARAWMAAQPPGTPVAWHPYPTSLRIVNWCRAGFDAPDLWASLYRQAAHLYRTQETYIRGNHLLENARALIFAGRYFDGQGEAPRWLERGLHLFRTLTPEVVLPDGGFYERSPMYHALMLEAYLDVLNVLPEGHPDAPALARTARRMDAALRSMTHPDGTLVLFNDATHEIAPSPASLHAYADTLLGMAVRAPHALPDTGLYVHASDRVFLAVDGGKLAPDDLPAHGHADLFTYELSLDGARVVVDSGVFEYQAGPARQYGRSTRAHNTVTVDGADQAEVYGSFRVGRRYDPEGVTFDETPGHSRFRGTFRGYARLLGDGLVHHREIVVNDAAGMITVSDLVEGEGSHRVESRIHLHPEAVLAVEVNTASVRVGEAQCVVRANVPLVVETGAHSPRFGERQPNAVLVLTHQGRLPARLSYTLHY